MRQEEFNSNSNENSMEYHAVCYLKNKKHWVGEWKKSYTEAFNDGEKHRYENQGDNQIHDVRIER